MICLLTDDEFYYKNLDELKEQYKVDEFHIMPTIEELKLLVLKENRVGIVTPVKYPYSVFGDLLVYKLLNAKNGLLTIQEIENNVKDFESLGSKLFLDVYDWKSLPNIEGMAGSKGFIDWVHKITALTSKGKTLKPSIFVGMAGCGKSRGVEALANFWKVPMLDLKIQKIMEHDRPYELIDKIFGFLHRTKIKCVLRMDEIEQMLEDKGMLGNLLTLFNNLNTPKGYTVNGAIIATANNISDIITKAPQFFRHGRWNEKFFVSFPTTEDAKKIMGYYYKVYGVDFSELNKELNKQCGKIDLEAIFFEIVLLANEKYSSYNLASNEDKFVYAPSEIDYLFERLSHIKIKNYDDIKKELDVVVPLQVTASKGVFEMYSEAKKLAFKDLNQD